MIVEEGDKSYNFSPR